MTLDDVVNSLAILQSSVDDLKIFVLAGVIGIAFLFALELVYFAPRFLAGWWR